MGHVEQCLEAVCRGGHLVQGGLDQSDEEIRVVVAIDMTSAIHVPGLSAFYPLGTQIKSSGGRVPDQPPSQSLYDVAIQVVLGAPPTRSISSLSCRDSNTDVGAHQPEIDSLD